MFVSTKLENLVEFVDYITDNNLGEALDDRQPKKYPVVVVVYDENGPCRAADKLELLYPDQEFLEKDWMLD